MDQIIWHLLTICFAVAGWETGKAIIRRIQMPYRWKCKECSFTVRTSSRDSFEISKTSHNHITNREYR